MILRRTMLTAATALAAVSAMAVPASARHRSAKSPRQTAPLRLASADEQLTALREGKITSRSLLEQHLEHIARSNPALNAVITLDAESARAAADKADAHLARTGEVLGALHGLPMTVKDALEVAGMRTTCGSPDLSDHVPDRDADAVALLRAAGAIIIGHTNVPTMCQDLQTSNPLFGKTLNPFDADRTAGGSSGGPAAAVAAGFTSLEIGSDLAGSLRLPAAYCGVYALRTSRGTSPIVPTRGHIPRLPGWSTSSDMITLGPIARTVDDLALLLDVIAAPAPADRVGWKIDLPAPARSKLSEFRVGVWADHPYCPVDADTRALLQRVTELLRTAGADIDDSTEPVDFAESDKLFQRLMYATSSATATNAAFAADVEAAEKIPADDPSGLFLRSRTMRHRDWCVADEARQKLRASWDAYFSGRDILITPATPTAAVPDQTSTPPPKRYITVDGQKRSFYDQTGWLNLTSPVGLPSLVLPAGKTETGLPLAIQIIGPYLADRTVLRVAKQLAKRLPSPARPPVFSA
ncbi:amidase [Streptomyces sp. NBC_01433]|uniref:amidase n=1 Tax=Streptomyces sp. NBC_01433 TaxID=2903864 RepID=UPI002259D8BD|nr:amidase [Streptomyces sp. NBC_01433]MCX4681609.1 amidase [Streptomyces sp. NBC_01433]